MSSIDSSAPAICRLRTTPPISINCVWSKPFGAGLVAIGCTLSSVTVSEWSPPRLRPASIRHFDASTSAIETPSAPVASTAKCFAAFANGTPRARPERLPSALSVMRSFGAAGTTVISPSGEEIFACSSSHPASMVSASGTAMAWRPAALSTANPSARLAPRAAAIFADPGERQSGFAQRLPQRRFPRALVVAIDGLGVGEIGEDLFRGLGDNVLTLRHSVPRC